MKRILIINTVISLLFFSTAAYADCRGCCSSHGGVVCSGGVTMCADGTHLSDTCINKGCNVCEDDPIITYTYYLDNDGDSYGNPDIAISSSSIPSGYVDNHSDCNDSDSSIFPGATEIPDDGIDQDCDGSDLTTQNQDDTIKIANFNIQIFGITKADKPGVMDILARTITEFDIVAIQEIRDASGTAIVDLENEVDALGEDYTTIVGPRLGRTSSKEQYAYMFRTNLIEYIDAYTFDDSASDDFHREPLIAQFQATNGNFDFVLVTLHTDPDEATEEINALLSVVTDAKNYFAEKDVIILGDLNADCSYFDEDDYDNPMRADGYTWLIDNDMDTNLAASSCTYDRIIILDDSLSDFTGDADVYRFDDIYNLAEDDAKDVSDHYPVWAEFYINNDYDGSDETTQHLVSEIYVATFGRSPAYAGLTYWTNALETGDFTIDQVAQSFFDQPETKAMFPEESSNLEFITTIYYNVLNRAPAEAGLAYWVDALDSGTMRRDQAIMAIINGAKSETGSSDDAAMLAKKTEIGVYFANSEIGRSFTDDENFMDWATNIISFTASDDFNLEEAEEYISGLY